MISQALRRAQAVFLALRLVLIDLGNGVDDAGAFTGEVRIDVDELTARLKPELHANANILVKGSRFMQMERVVEALRDPQAVSEGA